MRRMEALFPKRAATDLALETFRVISDWHHFAILQIMTLPGVGLDAVKIGRRLGLPRAEIDVAIERLKSLDLLVPDDAKPGRFKRAKSELLFKTTGANAALRKFNRQILEKAIASLEDQPAEDKVFGTEMVALPKKCLPEARALADEFLDRIVKLAESTREKPSDVYQVALQMFNLTPERKSV